MCLFCGSSSVRLQYNRVRPPTVAEQLAGPADIILHGGPILTMNASRPEAMALAVRQGLVQAAGSLEEAMSHKGRPTRVLDLEGRAVLPGFVRANLSKDPVDFLDWQSIRRLPSRGGDLDASLARSIMPSIFVEPVFVRITGVAQPWLAYAPLLKALALQCRGAPVAVLMPGGTAGFANDAMLRLAPAPDRLGAVLEDGFTFVADMPAMLRPMATTEEHSAASVTRALEAKIHSASKLGFTMVVDPRMGSIAGKREIDAATVILKRSRRVRMQGAAHERLRQQWDGTFSQALPPGWLCIDVASVNVAEPTPYLSREVAALHQAGWRIAFDVRSEGDLEVVLQLCSESAIGKERGVPRHRIESAIKPDDRQRNAIGALGLALSIEPKTDDSDYECLGKDIDNSVSVFQRLTSLTRDAAGRRGLEGVAGSIEVGRRADFTLLEGLPFATDAIRVDGTWVDGAPI